MWPFVVADIQHAEKVIAEEIKNKHRGLGDKGIVAFTIVSDINIYTNQA